MTDSSSSRIYSTGILWICLYVQHYVLSWRSVKNGDNSENIKINSIRNTWIIILKRKKKVPVGD